MSLPDYDPCPEGHGFEAQNYRNQTPLSMLFQALCLLKNSNALGIKTKAMEDQINAEIKSIIKR